MNQDQYYDIFILIGRIKEKSDQFIVRELKKRNIEGIVPSHGDIITSLFRSQTSLTMNEIGQLVYKTQATVSVLVDKLEKNGLVVRERDAKDRRVVRVSLTEKGKEVAEIVYEIANELVSQYNLMLPETELKDLQHLLSLLVLM